MTKSLHRHYKSHGKERRKRCVFRRLQKTGRDGADVTWRGRSFQVRVAATGKARSPTVDSRVRRTDSDDVDAERRRVLVSESADWRSSSAKYDGAVPWRHLYAKTASVMQENKSGLFSEHSVYIDSRKCRHMDVWCLV